MPSPFVKSLTQNVATFAFNRAERSFRKRNELQAELLGEKLGKLSYKLFKRHSQKGHLSLGVAFPSMSEGERDEMIRNVYIHFGRVAGDFLRSMDRSDQEVLASIEVEGYEIGMKAVDEGKGILAVLPHFGNWERLAHWFKATGGTISVVARDANSGEMNRQILRIRSNAGLHVISRDGGATEVFRRLKNQEIIGILPDQNSNESFLPFFGKPAGTVLTPAKLAIKTGVPMLPVFCPRIGPAKYKLIVKEPVPIGPNTTPEEVMTYVNAEFEKVIREYPDQYLWLHDRWKSARRRGLL